MRELKRVNGVELCVETLGRPDDPPILLIAGMSGSMDGWEDAFCARLAEGRRYVIRYDQRDTGQSVTYPAGSPPYSFDDLVSDAAGIVDALGLPAAHVAGISMGGAVAQLLALDHADRVASLTLISTTGAADPDLPAIGGGLAERGPEPAQPTDVGDRAAVVDYLVASERWMAGRQLPFDEPARRALNGRVFDRSRDLAATLTNHHHIPRRDGWGDRLGDISAPTLVLHGTDDPLFPIAHGRALAAAIPGALFVPLDKVGHEMPPPAAWDVVIAALLRHTSGGWDQQADRLAADALAAGEPTAWFDRLYASAEAGAVDLPWDKAEPRAPLVRWAGSTDLKGAGRRALVVGCGLGQEAEYINSLGFATDAFDISPTAIEVVRRRYPDSAVRYHVADLLDPPVAWRAAFDLVVEVYTVQALPRSLRAAATANVAAFVGPDGTLVVVAAAVDEPAADEPAADEPGDTGPPWPLTRAEVDAFAGAGLQSTTVDRLTEPRPSWLAEFRRFTNQEA